MNRSALPGGADERLHVVEIPLERATAGGGELVLRSGDATLERLGAGDVLRVLELARVDAQVAVGGVHQSLEIVEGERLVDGERAHDPESHALVDQTVESE